VAELVVFVLIVQSCSVQLSFSSIVSSIIEGFLGGFRG